MVPEAINASEILLEEGIYSVVINVTGPGPLYRNYRNLVNESVIGAGQISKAVAKLFPGAIQRAPVVTVADAHPHALAWIGGALESRIFPLGVYDWGQSGSRYDLYKEYGTDADSIVAAGMAVLEG
jgi:pyruvate dehydrogenase E1 component